MRRILGLAVAGLLLVAACGGGGGGSASKTSFCDTAKTIKNSGDSFNKAFSDNDPKALDAANVLFKSLKDKAPSEIKGDMTTIADFFSKFVDALKSAGNDTAKQIAAFTSLAKDQAKVEAATKNVDAYAEKNCGFTLSSDTSSSSSSSDKSSKNRSSSSSSSDFMSDMSNMSDFSFDTNSLDSMLSSLSNAFSDFSSFSTPSN